MIFTYALVQDRKRCSLLEWWSAFAVHRAQLMSLREFHGKPSNQRISRGKFVQIAANSNPWCRDDATKPPIMHNWIESDSSDLENTQQQFEDLQCSSILSINTIYSVFIHSNKFPTIIWNEKCLPMKMLMRWAAMRRWRGMNNENCSLRSNDIGTFRFGIVIFARTGICSDVLSPKRLEISGLFL